MKHLVVVAVVLVCVFAADAYSQKLVSPRVGTSRVPDADLIRIVKAEDARRYDSVLESLMKAPNPGTRKRALLAAGRIGDPASGNAISLLLKEGPADVRAVAAFALGELENVNATFAITRSLEDAATPDEVRARLVEAAGKIVAADPKAADKRLGDDILKTLDDEYRRARQAYGPTIRLGLTAVLRARPVGAEETVRKFLSFTDPDVVADALNTLARLRAKNANRDARDLLSTHTHAVVRANAARVLGAADDKDAVDLLIKAATSDVDARVRVSSVRALAAIKVAKSADPLLARGETLLAAYKRNLRPDHIPAEQNEFIEVATALGQILAKTGNARAIALFADFLKVDKFSTPEPYIARVKVGGIRRSAPVDDAPVPTTYRQYSTLAQVLGEFAAYEPDSDAGKKIKDEAPAELRKLVNAFLAADPAKEPVAVKAAPDALTAFARFKTDDLGEILRGALKNNDVQIRAAAAGLIADLPPTDENIDAVNRSFDRGWKTDVESNDAILAALDALFKLDKKGTRGSVAAFMLAAASPDQLVRSKAITILKDGAYKNKPELQTWLMSPQARNASVVRPYSGTGTRIGQILNTDADYRRALARKNGTVKALLTTAKGKFTIVFNPEEAPLTVDNFVKLARSGYFNGLEVHRVVPNFVMQDGDPRGDGNGGPGWSIRCEINMLPYDRGAVGMALSGKDTGGSQWFVTHSPQPHLDGGYTVFGHVSETDMKVVDNIVRGDRILRVQIIGR